MANLVEYVKTVWENGKTALDAARMNNMEKGISDCATKINKLGDSVSLIGKVRTIQASRESTSEAMSAVFSRVWGQINLNCPTFIVVPSGGYGSAVLGLAFKTSDTYGVVFEIGYGNSAVSWRLVNGQWIKP